MTRRIEEGDLLAVLELHFVSADVLGDATRFSRDHVRLADVVEQGGLTVVDVTHHGDDRATRV